ncbi:unnamed protein product [Parajaminaea phylloscopi]
MRPVLLASRQKLHHQAPLALAKHTQHQQRRTMLLKANTLAQGKGKLFEGQASLPSLPVPPVEQTLSKYLRSTVPHQTPASLAKTEAAVQSALSGADAELFKTLQKRLQDRAADPASEGNWLASWWNTAAYMSYRDPVVPYVSYFYCHKDDKLRTTGPKRAAAMLKATLAFRKLVESEELAPEKTKNGYLCSASYPWMFNATRLPAQGEDEAVKYPASSNNHVVVVRKGRYYEFDLVDAKSGAELSAAEIESQLFKITQQAPAQADAFPIGALTSDNRDKWLASREALIAASPKNKASLERIQSAVIVVCLDDAADYTREELAWRLWYGDGKNRFYDKQQFIVTENGKSGYMGEHSTMDGTPTLRLNDFVLNALAANKVDLGTSARNDLPAPTEIAFQINSDVESRVLDSVRAFELLKSKHDLAVLDFQGYGKGAIKEYKCSPDAWAQMVIQLAYYKMYGRPAPTYESAQTRKFRWGRTETIRSASVESKAFCEAMEDPRAQDEDRYAKFQAAVKQHLSYATAAADGQGVDRHLFGLKKLLQEGEQLPEIYRDEAFAKTSNWQLSTSQISSESFDCWGFGEVTPDGFGCAYAIKEKSLTFTLTSLRLGADRLRHFINEAAVEVRDLHDRLAAKSAAGSDKAKL